MWNSFLKSAGGVIKTTWDNVENRIENGIDEIGNGIKNGIKNGVDKVGNELEYTFNNKTDPIGKRPKEALVNTVEQVTQGFDKEFPGVSSALSTANGYAAPVVKSLTDQAEYEAENGEISPMAAVGHGIRTIRGAGNAGAHLAHKLNVDQDIGRFIFGLGAETVLTAGVSRTVGAAKNLPPLSGPPGPSLATAGITPQVPTFKGGTVNLTPQVMEIASDMKPASWSTSVRSLQKSGSNSKEIEKVLSKPYHKGLKKKYEAITLKELSEDKGGWLEMLMDRQDDFKASHKKFMSTKKAGDQRSMYDNYTENPLQSELQMYDNSNPIRKAVTKAFNTVAGKEWHHIFGNKEAAEYMLSQVAQDPYIAVNLLHFLRKINLPTSGTPSNIALMKKALHRKKGGYHSWAKQLGIENAGKRKGDLVISDYGQEISKGILDGSTDVNEIFSILETYAKLNNKVIKPKLKDDFGATIISEMGPVMKFVQGAKSTK